MKGNLWMEIRSEKKKGLSYAEIGRKHHIDSRTAKKLHFLNGENIQNKNGIDKSSLF